MSPVQVNQMAEDVKETFVPTSIEPNESDCTKNGTITFDDLYVEWLISMTLSVFCSVLVIYIILSLSFFTWKTKACGGNSTDNGSTTLTGGGSTVVLVLSFALSFSTLFHFVSLLPLFAAPSATPKEPFCEFYHRFSTALAGVSFSAAFFALWFRIYVVFYRHPLIKNSLNKVVLVLSKAAVVFLAVMVGINLANFLSAPAYTTCIYGCLRVRDDSQTALKWGTLIASAVLFQATLLFLLVYPLIMHRKNMINSGFQSGIVMPIIKRAFVTAIFCTISNVVIGLYGIASDEKFTYIRHIVYGINFVISLIALICFSADWKERLFPCYLVYKKRRHLHSPTSTMRNSHYHCNVQVNSIKLRENEIDANGNNLHQTQC